MADQPISGVVIDGAGAAAGFMRLDWVRSQATRRLGIDPYPGTLNLRVAEHSRASWTAVRATPGELIEPPDGFCQARCYAMSVDDHPVAALVPAVPEYPQDVIELIAAVRLRDALRSDDPVTLVPYRRPRLRAILFDIDGTLVDSLPAFEEVARVAAAPHGFEIGMEHIRAALATNSSFWGGIVAADHPRRDALMRSMAQHARREWRGILHAHARLQPDVHATLATLRRRGFRLGIVTGAGEEMIEWLGEQGVAKYFDAIVTANDVARRKPDPEGLHRCLMQLGIDAAAACYIGDAPIDIEASRAAGVAAFGVLTGAGDSAMLTRARALRILASIADLPDVVDFVPPTSP